jgi:hypothetical protein
MPSLAPENSTEASLVLTPDEDQPFGDFTGSLVIYSNRTSINLNFRFSVVSTVLADLTIFVEDEFTYYAPGNYIMWLALSHRFIGNPGVVNATVTIRNVNTNFQMTLLSNADGVAYFDNITEVL